MSRRLDAYLVEEGLIRSRERAKEAIKAGRVKINGTPARKPGQTIQDEDHVECEGDTHHYVSRGALKLLAGLETFPIHPADKICLDLGASTGGFTQVLLERGARKIFAVDVGTGQLEPTLGQDQRVVNLERTHAYDLSPDIIPDEIDLLVCDVSFISLKKALPPVFPLLSAIAEAIILIKPQFELGQDHLGKGGLVTLSSDDLQKWNERDMLPWFQDSGWDVLGVIDSPIKGGDGNHEFLIGVRKNAA